MNGAKPSSSLRVPHGRTNGSEAFVSGANRDSLEPIPVASDGPKVHRGVEASSTAAQFSASRGHPVWPIELGSCNISLSIGALDPGCSTSMHRHAYETLVYVLSGTGHSVIEDERISWQAGDAFYVPPWNWHQHIADDTDSVRYIAATNLPLLIRLGQTVVRQERKALTVPSRG